MAFWCYILRCSDRKYYTGHTDDLERRIAEHRQGGYCHFTSTRRPIELIWAADFPTRHEALSAELQVKKWPRAKKEALAEGDWQRVSHFAKPPRERCLDFARHERGWWVIPFGPFVSSGGRRP